MNSIRLIFMTTLLLLSTNPSFGQEEKEFEEEKISFNYKGYVDTYHAVRSKAPSDFMSSRTQVRFESTLEKGDVSAFASINATYNAILKNQTGLELREAYLSYTKSNWEVKAGKQIVIWGVADGLRVTDLISPMDYTEFLARDYDEIRVPVGAIKIGYNTSSFHLEGIWVPVPEYFILPYDSINPWAINYGNKPISILEHQPSKKLNHSEYGLRASFYKSGVDFSFYALRTWNKQPAYTSFITKEDHKQTLESHHERMTMIGADLSLPINKVVLRCEVAEYFSQIQSSNQPNQLPIKGNTFNALIGLDWYPGNDYTLMVQYLHRYISNYKTSMSSYRNSGVATATIKKELFRNTLKLSGMGRFDCSNRMGFFLRLNADYLLTDEITISVGYDWFNAHKGQFAMYNDNSEVFVKARFSF